MINTKIIYYGIEYKKCKHCNNIKQNILEFFSKNGKRLHTTCKLCKNTIVKNKRIIARNRNTEEYNLEKEKCKKYYLENKERILAERKIKYLENIEERRKRDKIYYKKYKEKHLLQRKIRNVLK